MRHLICQIEAIAEVARLSDEENLLAVMEALYKAGSRLQGELHGRQRDPRDLARSLISQIEERRQLNILEAVKLYPEADYYDAS